MIDQRGRLLMAALGFAGCSMPSNDRALHELDSWSGIGHVAVGMARQGYDRQLTRYDERGWRANFYITGMEHSPTSATGTGWERTPWHATRAAWEALRKGSGGRPMNDRLEAISRLISAVARQEDQELRPLGRGIAFVPELAFAYLVGRAITARSSDIFGTPDVRWATDELIAGFGRSGLVFHPAAPGKSHRS
jgi:hypothetical protein